MEVNTTDVVLCEFFFSDGKSYVRVEQGKTKSKIILMQENISKNFCFSIKCWGRQASCVVDIVLSATLRLSLTRHCCRDRNS